MLPQASLLLALCVNECVGLFIVVSPFQPWWTLTCDDEGSQNHTAEVIIPSARRGISSARKFCLTALYIAVAAWFILCDKLPIIECSLRRQRCESSHSPTFDSIASRKSASYSATIKKCYFFPQLLHWVFIIMKYKRSPVSFSGPISWCRMHGATLIFF